MKIQKGFGFLKKIVSLFMVLSLFCSVVFSANMTASASSVVLSNNDLEPDVDSELESELDPQHDVSMYILPAVVAPIIGLILKKAVKEAVKQYGKQVVIDAVMKELGLPKTISGKSLIKKLKKVGFKEVRQKGSHVTMKGPNGKTFTVPLHKELAKGTYDSIKKSIKNSIAP